MTGYLVAKSSILLPSTGLQAEVSTHVMFVKFLNKLKKVFPRRKGYYPREDNAICTAECGKEHAAEREKSPLIN